MEGLFLGRACGADELGGEVIDGGRGLLGEGRGEGWDGFVHAGLVGEVEFNVGVARMKMG